MESIPVPVSVVVEVRAEGGDVGSLERAVGAALTEVGQRVWSELQARLEALLPRAT